MTKKLHKRLGQYCECLLRGLSEREISKEMGITVSTVKQHSLRAKKFFKVDTAPQAAVAYYKMKEENDNMLEKYNYNEKPSGRTETLVQTVAKLEQTEKALNLALDGLKILAQVNPQAIDIINNVEETLKDDDTTTE